MLVLRLCQCHKLCGGLQWFLISGIPPSAPFRKLVFDSTMDLLRGKTFRALRGKRSADWDWDITQRRQRQRPRFLEFNSARPSTAWLLTSRSDVEPFLLQEFPLDLFMLTCFHVADRLCRCPSSAPNRNPLSCGLCLGTQSPRKAKSR